MSVSEILRANSIWILLGQNGSAIFGKLKEANNLKNQIAFQLQFDISIANSSPSMLPIATPMPPRRTPQYKF